jgi:hypothetical protein
MKFHVRSYDVTEDLLIEAPEGCDGYPMHTEVVSVRGELAMVCVWRVTPPPIPASPPRKPVKAKPRK